MTQQTTLLTSDTLDELAAVNQSPCLSLYQRTHRHHPENQQDPIRFGNLVKELEASLGKIKPAVDTKSLLKPFLALAEDRDFWNHAQDGLAVLGGPGMFRVFRLQRPVANLVVVADSFHTKPLRRFQQSADRYQVLGLSLDKISLFEGNRDALDEIESAPGVPRTLTDALGEELTDQHSTVASYGGTGPGASPMHHGHGGEPSALRADTERYFRAVDRAVHEHHSQPSGLPLILAALREHHHLFREVSHNPLLVGEGVAVNPDAVAIDELREKCWQVLEPHYAARIAKMADNFSAAKANGLGSEKLDEVAKAAAEGRVATLLVESGRQIPGHIDPATGKVEPADLSHPEVDDLLDDLGELVAKKGGQVMVVPAEQMPARTGLAATYRY